MRVLEHADRERACQSAPLGAAQARRARRGDGRVARAPAGPDLPARKGEVGHRRRLVVARSGLPAVVATFPQPVDLVVAVGALLDRPHHAVGAQREPLHVAVAVGVDPRFIRLRASTKGLSLQAPPVRGFTRSTLPPPEGEALRVLGRGGVARGDVQRTLGPNRNRHPPCRPLVDGQPVDDVAHPLGGPGARAEPPEEDLHLVLSRHASAPWQVRNSRSTPKSAWPGSTSVPTRPSVQMALLSIRPASMPCGAVQPHRRRVALGVEKAAVRQEGEVPGTEARRSRLHLEDGQPRPPRRRRRPAGAGVSGGRRRGRDHPPSRPGARGG